MVESDSQGGCSSDSAVNRGEEMDSGLMILITTHGGCGRFHNWGIHS